jgi:cathepsin L
MKLFVFVCLVGIAAAEVSLHAVLQAKWNNFKATHGKEYHRAEEPQRLNAFLQNSLHIEQHNEQFAKGEKSYQLGHNEYSDMTHEEFQNKVLIKMPQKPECRNQTIFSAQPNLNIPHSVDWTSVTPWVKNQGQCGSCYTFGSIGALEGLYARKYGHNIRLSEQHLLDCTRAHGNQGCGGGWDHDCFEFVKRNGGVFTEQQYPYKGQEGYCPAQNKNIQYARVSNYIKVKDVNSFTQAVATVGPISAALDANPRDFLMYRSGVYNNAQCGASGWTTHIVTVVGYGEEAGIPYYLIKNSWGTSWGEGGFMKLARNKCLIAQYGVYPVID